MLTNLSQSYLFYGFTVLIYNTIVSVVDAKSALIAYKTIKNTENYQIKNSFNFEYHLNKCNSKWEAVNLGITYNFYDRLSNSIIWPYFFITGIIPTIVIYFDKD